MHAPGGDRYSSAVVEVSGSPWRGCSAVRQRRSRTEAGDSFLRCCTRKDNVGGEEYNSRAMRCPIERRGGT